MFIYEKRSYKEKNFDIELFYKGLDLCTRYVKQFLQMKISLYGRDKQIQ